MARKPFSDPVWPIHGALADPVRGPAEALRVRPIVVPERARTLHLAQRRPVEHPAVVAALVVIAAPALHDEPPGEVLDGRPEPAVSEDRRRVEWLARRGVVVVAARTVALGAAGGEGRVGKGRRRRQAGHVDDLALEVRRERLSGDPPDGNPEQVVGDVAVPPAGLGRCHDRDPVEAIEELLLGEVRNDPQVVRRDVALQPGAVGEEPPDRQLFDRPERVRDRPRLRDVRHERVVESEPALVAKLQDGRRSERFRDRGDAKERVGRHGSRGRAVGEPEGRGPRQLPVADDAHREARQALLDEESSRQRVEPRCQGLDDRIHARHHAELRRSSRCDCDTLTVGSATQGNGTVSRSASETCGATRSCKRGERGQLLDH